jgi:diaminohydroxyphosphoribosylaminopyrimidine deaminase/5-amino-6-(5-phosphoribosylamino)uracil reductase
LRDPDPRVDGAGIARMRAAGIRVDEGLLQAEAADIAAGFTLRITERRPLVTLKLASTLDGRIATHGGESRWITAEPARRMAHALRGRHDAIMVGVGTVLADDPDLTCRIPGFRSTPMVRVVADSHLRTPLRARLIATAHDTPTWMLVRAGSNPDRTAAFTELGAVLHEVPGSDAGIDLAAGLTALADAGITRLLVEGGAKIAAALLRAGLVDRLAWFHAPGVMGADGWPAAQAFGITRLDAMPRFTRHRSIPVGDDMLTELRKVA